MKSKLAMFVVAFGFLVFGGYIYTDYVHNGKFFLEHVISPDNPVDAFFHIVIISTFIGSFIAAYLINDRKKLLERTRLSEQQLKIAAHEWSATFDSMPFGVLLTDRDCNIVRANKYIADMSGISVKELVSNKKCYKTICKKSRPFDFCNLKSSMKDGKIITHEHHYHEYNKIISESISPMYSDNGDMDLYVHVLADISDAKEKEKKIIQSKDAFFNMLKDMDATYKEMRSVYDSLVIVFSRIIDAKSPWTRGHSIGVAYYATAIAMKMGLKEADMEILRIAALLHDIGKIGTYDVILDKPDELTADEYDLVRRHTVKGEEILRPIKGLENILLIVRSHHERYDGGGYPDQLKGKDIHPIARILCVADAYDAMVSDRPYRHSRGFEFAITELKRGAGAQFDPDVVEAFLETIKTDSPGINLINLKDIISPLLNKNVKITVE
ncbi:MAG: HD domain-containing protein [Nitrospirae bacterium]|nr:HD domain-containing protein [Nitrospirota bacterium]